MKPMLYLEGVKLKQFANKSVYVDFLKTDVTKLWLLHTKTSKKWSLLSFSVSMMTFI